MTLIKTLIAAAAVVATVTTGFASAGSPSRFDLLGPHAELLDGDDAAWMKGYEFSLAGPIYAGTNEIQRNVIAERVLGLPRA